MSDKIKTVHQTVTEIYEPSVAVVDEKVAPSPAQSPTVASRQQRSPQPYTLENRSIFDLLYDMALLVIPVLLLLKVGLVIIAWYIDKDHVGSNVDQVSRLTKVVVEINGQMITIFTIVFVTVVSTLVKRYALYKAQRGAYLTKLEQYQGSVSLPSTFKLIWSLRAYKVRSLVLVFIWCFQYLGSQASKYEFRYADSGRFNTSIVAVRGPGTPSWLDPLIPREGSDIDVLTNNGLTASMFEPALGPTNGPHPGIDNNGRALVPDLDRILNRITVNGEASQAPKLAQDSHGWYDVSAQSSIKQYAAYTSAVGWKVFSEACMYEHCLGDYYYRPDYLDISCSAPTLQSFEAFPNGTFETQAVSMNMTAVTPSTPIDASGHSLRSFELWFRWPEDKSMSWNKSGSAVSTCNITQIIVEMTIACLPNGCLPRKMRWLNGGTKVSSTSYRTPFDSDEFAANFFTNILLSEGKQDLLQYRTTIGSSISPPREIIPALLSNSNPHEYWESRPDRTNYLHASLNTYYNTYYQLSQEFSFIMPNMTLILSRGTDGYYNATTLRGAVYLPQYAIAWEWIAIDIVSCLVLLFAAIAAALLRMWTIAPDILGAVSSLTRDNPYLDLPEHGTTLDGISRSRMLKNVKVKLCDVSSPHEQVGKIGLARADSELVQRSELRKTAQYV